MSTEEKINLAKLVSQIRNGHNNENFYRRKRVDTKEKNIVGAGGLILDISNNKLLVVKGPEKWSLPKGHLEPGEEPYEAAMREIFEETSLRIQLSESAKSKKFDKYIYYYIILENADQLQFNPIDNNEVSEVKWCSYEELLILNCNRQLKHFISRWKVILKLFYDNQKNLTMKGTVAPQEEILFLQSKTQHIHPVNIAAGVTNNYLQYI